METKTHDLFWKNISALPYFRGFLRSVEGKFYQELEMKRPVLDLGIGDGHFTSVTFNKTIDVGLDPSFSDLRKAKQKLGCNEHICALGNKLPFKSNHFSTIFSNSVLEHIQYVGPVMGEVNRVLCDDGIFIITVPNDNFTKNLSIGRFFNYLGLIKFAKIYQKFFNAVSRHYHPDPVSYWQEKLQKAGFKILESWNYFPKRSLAILEWGHFFGFPSWISKQIFGKWILIPKKWNLWPITFWLSKQYNRDQKSLEGAYTFFYCKKIGHNA
ncbi:MAG: class I SAM-dependent methyltransferase [Anaerolineaceae bacterium]|nr:class I SAM-dependent methyltransferase [Anaerolineaceae bacterium]